jgi:hypothetical protein
MFEQLKKVKHLTAMPVSWLCIQLFKYWGRETVSLRSVIGHLLIYYVSASVYCVVTIR